MSSQDQGDPRPPSDSEQSSDSPLPNLATHAMMLGAAALFIVDAVSKRPATPLMLLAVLCGIQFASSLLRYRMGHQEARDIRGSRALEFALGAVVLGLIGGIGLWLGPLPNACQVIAGLLTVACAGALLYIGDDIASGVRRADKSTVSTWFGTCTLPARLLRFKKPGDPDYPPMSIVEKLDEHGIPLARLFRPYRKAGAQRLSEVSGARGLMNVAIAVAGVALVLGGFVGSEQTGSADGPGGGGTSTPPGGTSEGGGGHGGKEPGGKESGTDGGDESGTGAENGDSAGDPVCGRYGPGDGLEQRNPLRVDFELLFRERGALNATEPIEPKGRCFEPVRTMDEDGGGAYQEQYSLGFETLKSLAVYSTRWGAGLVLEPAAADILALIEDGITLGVSPRIFVGGGDLYLLHVEAGTRALVRRRFNRADGDPEGFLHLPQAVVAAWHDRMRNFGTWLWPEERPASDDDDEKVYYDLMAPSVDGLGEETVATVAYDTDTDTAFIEGDSGWEYGVDGAHLDFVEISRIANTAR